MLDSSFRWNDIAYGNDSLGHLLISRVEIGTTSAARCSGE